MSIYINTEYWPEHSFNERLRLQCRYHDTVRNKSLKLAVFLHADTLMLDWCIDSAIHMEVGRPFGTIPQVSLTTLRRQYFLTWKMSTLTKLQEPV